MSPAYVTGILIARCCIQDKAEDVIRQNWVQLQLRPIRVGGGVRKGSGPILHVCCTKVYALQMVMWEPSDGTALLLCVMVGIRTALMESPEHMCPSCETPDQSPDVLIPNKYLRAMVTSFVNETSYVSTKKPLPVSAASSSASQSTSLPPPASAARTVVLKSDLMAASSGRQPPDLPPHLMEMPPPQVARAAQIKSEPIAAELMLSRQSQRPPAGTQMSFMSVSGGQPTAVRTTVGDQFDYQQPSRSFGHGAAVAQHAHHVVSYSQQPTALAASGSSVGQSQSAPSLLTHNQLE